jgi:hypothetical protein
MGSRNHLESGWAFLWGFPHTPFSNSGRNAISRGIGSRAHADGTLLATALLVEKEEL